MALQISWCLRLCILLTAALALVTDSIHGQQLLGSSFGVPGLNATYDYLILGGGTAGLALANRLSAPGTHSVAIIEAGSFYELSNSNASQIPRYTWNGAGQGFADVNPLVDWMFETQPEMGLGGKRIHYPRGRCLGGSSARNHMVYQRASRGAYQRWADEVGDAAFEWENFKAYFDRSTTFFQADMAKRPLNSTPLYDPAGERARDGPVKIAYANWVLPVTNWVMRATEALGMKAVAGWLDGDLIGTSWMLRSVHPETQVRESSETAYLRPALHRPNLVVYQMTMAMKVLFEGKEAVGALCNTLGKDFVLKARKEVIISAGAFQSPQLLMVSGIGPKETLVRHNIPVLVDAPGVGQEMEDHPAISVTRKVRVSSSTVLDSPVKNAAALQDFLQNGSGPLSSTGGEVVAWEKLPDHLQTNGTRAALSILPPDWPDLEYLTASSYPGPTPPDADDYAGITVVLISTFSRGNITISSPSMLDPPVITVNFLTHPLDQALAIAALRRVREIFAHPSLEPVVYGAEVAPGNATVTDAQILQYIRNSARTISHVSCTCKMGKRGDRGAVVDARGRVYGVERLRVVDLSAVPFLPPGHPQATVYAMAELVAEGILKQRGK